MHALATSHLPLPFRSSAARAGISENFFLGYESMDETCVSDTTYVCPISRGHL